MTHKAYLHGGRPIRGSVLALGTVVVGGAWFFIPAASEAIRNGTGSTGLGPQYELFWNTLDGGGVMFAESGDGRYELSGTIGQPEAGGSMTDASGAGYELTGGFWFAQVPGDCVFDGAVNLLDFGAFHDCAAGPNTSPSGDGCPCFDTDRDDDIDLRDFGDFQRQFHGP